MLQCHPQCNYHPCGNNITICKQDKYCLVFYYQLHYHMWPTDDGFSGSFGDFEAQALFEALGMMEREE